MKLVSVNLAMNIQEPTITGGTFYNSKTAPMAAIRHKTYAFYDLYARFDLYRPSQFNQFFHHYIPTNLLKRSK